MCSRALSIALVLWLPIAAQAYGPEGHRLAGSVAQSRLCLSARQGVADLAARETLQTLGFWADRIRGLERYRRSAPWHYVNIPDGQSADAHVHPAEGDVLWAIGRFRSRLADPRLAHAQRAEALRFLVHLVVDVHQPLHVGRASDRGGNAVEVEFRQDRMSLHRFWDTEAVGLGGATRRARQARLDALLDSGELTAGVLDPRAWAGESLALRGRIYAFRADGRLAEGYLRFARQLTARRLALAGLRLAAVLNDIYCR